MKRITWKIEKRKLKDLKPHPKNPREFTQKGMKDLENSINSIGFMQPININQDGVILSGHARTLKLKEMGETEADVYVPDRMLTPKQEEEVLVRANANTAGKWDWDLLANNFELEEINEWGLEVPDMEIEAEELEAKEDDFDAEPPAKPLTVLGDLYEIGEHRLLCGDSTCSDTVAKLMNGELADLMITDPPYGMNKKEIKNDSFEFYPVIVKSVMDGFLIFAKDNSSAYCFGLYPYFVEMHLQIKQYAFHYIQDLYWLKGTTRAVDNKYRQIIENIIYFSKNNNYLFNFYKKNYQKFEYYLGEMSMDFYKNSSKATDKNKKLYSEGLISMPNLLQYTNSKGFLQGSNNIEHPTMKPIEMLLDFMLQSSKEKDLVLDLFLGSGSTMVASHQLKRKCYGMELDPKYCDVIVKRMIKLDPSLKITRNGEDYKNEFI